MNEPLLKVEGLSKKFCKELKSSLWYGLKDLGAEITGNRHSQNSLRPHEFWSLKDINFELRRGECLGLIGRNGAGKTTLLRILNGLIKPDQGRVEIRGHVGAIIALGAGFNPILSGRENIRVAATMYGVKKSEIDRKMDEIIDFAELGEFIDMPLQSYSSGMAVRLGFASASVIQPDILLLDEVLAVGDAAFRTKCYQRMDELRERTAMIFVSHDMPNISRICNKLLVLDHGESKHLGNVIEGIGVYEQLNESSSMTESSRQDLLPSVTSLSLDEMPKSTPYFAPLKMRLQMHCTMNIGEIKLHINVKNSHGVYVASSVIESAQFNCCASIGNNVWNIELSALPLKAGHYFMSFGITKIDGSLVAIWHNAHKIEITGGHPAIVSECQLHIVKWETQVSTLELPK